MITTAPALTAAGQAILAQALAGQSVNFTRFEIGSGELAEGQDAGALTALIAPALSFGITAIAASGGYTELTGAFDSSAATEDFRWRELGVYCEDANGTERLFAYCNDGDDAGVLRAGTSDVLVEQSVVVVIATGAAEHVTATLTEGALYATNADLADTNAALADTNDALAAHEAAMNNPHNVTKQQIGLGNVPNVTTDDQTPTVTEAASLAKLTVGDKLSVIVGKCNKAIGELLLHKAARDNPHEVTAVQAGAAPAVEEYTMEENSSTWYVRKHGDGFAECWIRRCNVGNVVTSTAAGSFFTSASSIAVTFPIVFTEPPVASVNTHLSDTFIGGVDTGTENVYFKPYRMLSGTAGSFRVNIHAVGRWF